jgi:hypothetical protein
MQPSAVVYRPFLWPVLLRLRAVRGLALLLTVLALPACSSLFPDSYRYGAVDVTVVDMEGVPVAGADLVLYTGARRMAYGTTNVSGSFRFSYVPADGYGVYLFPPQGYFVPPDSLPYRYVDLPEGGTGSVSFVVQHGG